MQEGSRGVAPQRLLSANEGDGAGAPPTHLLEFAHMETKKKERKNDV